MTTVVDVSNKLGEYMLKGWVLTDRICNKCSKVPLMRSPADSTVFFCANCDGGPPTAPSLPVSQPASRAQVQSEASSVASLDSASHVSRPSTPPTEVSSVLSSPTFAVPVDTAEVLRRRQQSDAASAEIGKRLLKGWAMLADECPNPQCYGIPLVRPPKSGSEKDPRKECVICHTVYTDQTNASGMQYLAPLSSTQPPAPSTSSASIAKLFQSSVRQEEQTPQDDPIVIDPIPASIKEKLATTSPTRDLDATAATLEQSLRSLTQKLDLFSNGNNVDAFSIGQTADAISKVSQALMHVKQLRWSERQALGS